jgi:hypothetical protein
MNLKLILSALAITVTIPTTLSINSAQDESQYLFVTTHIFDSVYFSNIESDFLNLINQEEEILGDELIKSISLARIFNKDLSLKNTFLASMYHYYVIREYMHLNRLLINKLIQKDFALTQEQKGKFRFAKNAFLNQRSIIQSSQQDIRSQFNLYKRSLSEVLNNQNADNVSSHQHQFNALMEKALTFRRQLKTMLGQLETFKEFIMSLLSDTDQHVQETLLLFTSMKNQIVTIQEDFKKLTIINNDIRSKIHTLYKDEVDISLYSDLVQNIKGYFQYNYSLLNRGVNLLRTLYFQVGNYSSNITTMDDYSLVLKATIIKLNTIQEALSY